MVRIISQKEITKNIIEVSLKVSPNLLYKISTILLVSLLMNLQFIISNIDPFPILPSYICLNGVVILVILFNKLISEFFISIKAALKSLFLFIIYFIKAVFSSMNWHIEL